MQLPMTVRNLVIIRQAGMKNGHKYVEVECSCGKVFITRLSAVLYEKVILLSCGCLGKRKLGDLNRSHGKSKTVIYKVWEAMLHRCESPACNMFPNYGGRGIRVCEEWLEFVNFYRDMGEVPFPKAQIDRIDVNGDYCKENCRWVTNHENSLNKRNTRVAHLPEGDILWYDIKRILERHGISLDTFDARWRLGWDIEKILGTPRMGHPEDKEKLQMVRVEIKRHLETGEENG